MISYFIYFFVNKSSSLFPCLLRIYLYRTQVMKKLLGLWTLLIKIVGTALSVGSGLILGSEVQCRMIDESQQ